MWAIMCAYFTYVYCLWIFLSWLPSYLVEFRHFTLLKVGFLASLPLWAGVVGDTVGGLATDWLLAKTGNIKFARRAVAITGMLGCAVFIVPAALATEAYTAVYCLTAAMFFLECTIGPSWAVPMDMGGEVSGTVSGMMNMAGNIGGALSPIVFGVGPVRIVAGAIHRRRQFAGHRFSDLGILARPEPLGGREAAWRRHASGGDGRPDGVIAAGP
jgi:sugar phosphate permease